MDPLNPFRQSEAMCGPASLKILLSHYGKHFSERELATLCDATVESGTTADGLVSAIRSLGYAPVTKTNATIDDLRAYLAQDVPVLVAWYSTDMHHYSIAYDVTESDIFLMDPETEDGMRTMPISEFETLWGDHDSVKKIALPRWMLVIPELTSPR